MRALGLDLGSRRIGVALCDSAGTTAVPLDTVERCGDRPREHRRIAELVEEAEAEVVVVGLPLSLDGSEGPAARRTRREVRELARALPVDVETYDERLSTVTAERSLQEAGVSGPKRRDVVDRIAASVILQGWLDSRRDDEAVPGAVTGDPGRPPVEGRM